MVNKLQRN